MPFFELFTLKHALPIHKRTANPCTCEPSHTRYYAQGKNRFAIDSLALTACAVLATPAAKLFSLTKRPIDDLSAKNPRMQQGEKSSANLPP